MRFHPLSTIPSKCPARPENGLYIYHENQNHYVAALDISQSIIVFAFSDYALHPVLTAGISGLEYSQKNVHIRA